ncbi:MAG: DUF1059 domain-containing protein [Acidimicrobiia bacterium]
MFTFVCERLIPGCTHEETAESRAEAREKAIEHLEGYHRMESLNDMRLPDAASKLDGAIFPGTVR